jgi:hypothetical protein
MSAPCCGARDKSAPKDVIWKTVPHRLLFTGSSHHYWGAGGCAYLHPECDPNEKSHVCIYKITYVCFVMFVIAFSTSAKSTLVERRIVPLIFFSLRGQTKAN